MSDVTETRRSRVPDKQFGVERSALLNYLFFGLIVLMVPVALAGSTRIFDDGDVSWHIATGRWIIDNGRIPDVDPFSFTMGGQPWVAIEWLSEIAYASAFNLFGYSGLAAIVAAALMALHLIVFLHLRRRAGPLAILLALVAMDLVLEPFMLARPHVLAWPLLAGWTAMLLRAREERRPPPLWTTLIMALWANLHGSFPLGLVIFAAVGLDAMIESGWTRDTFKRWLLFGLLSTAAVLLNANGISGVLHPFTITGMKTLTMIEEWRPSNPSQTPWFFAGLLATLGAIMLRGARMRVGETALLLLMLAMAFHQVRHQSWLAIVALLIVPPAMARPVSDQLLHRRAPLAAAAALAFALILARLALPSSPSENSANPRRLLAAVPEELRTEPVLNGYSMGGPLILAGIKPYIDGRADMYGDDFFLDYQKIGDGDIPRFRRAIDRYGIRWTMLPHSHERLIRALDQAPEWRRHYSDDVGVIHIRSRPERRLGSLPVMPAN